MPGFPGMRQLAGLAGVSDDDPDYALRDVKVLCIAVGTCHTIVGLASACIGNGRLARRKPPPVKLTILCAWLCRACRMCRGAAWRMPISI